MMIKRSLLAAAVCLAGLARAENLRYGYVQLKSSEYLLTGYSHTPSTTVELVFNMPDPGEVPQNDFRALFGARGGGGDSDHSMAFFPWNTYNRPGKNAAAYARDGVVYGYDTQQFFIYGKWVKMVCDAQGASWCSLNNLDDVRRVVCSVDEPGHGNCELAFNGIYVGGSYVSGGIEGVRLRSFKISDSDSSGASCAIYPMKLEDGSDCLYDPSRNQKISIGGGAGPYTFGGVLHTVSDDGTTIRMHEGSVEDGDLLGYAVVEKCGAKTVNASVQSSFPSLEICEGELSFRDDEAKSIKVEGNLKLVGGASATLDVILGAEGANDSLNPSVLDLSEASATNPFVFKLVTSGSGTFGTDDAIVLVSSGFQLGDEAKIRIEGFPAIAEVREDGALLARMGGFEREANEITLSDDCVWTGVDINGPFFKDLAIDLRGHTLELAGCDGKSLNAFTVTDSQTGGKLVLDVPANATFTNTKINFEGALELVKTGPGMFVSKVFTQPYTGGTTVAGGVVKLFNNDLSGYAEVDSEYALNNYKYPLGVHKSLIKVETGAMFDVNGIYDTCVYNYELAGGTLANSKAQTHADWGSLGNVRLTANSFANFANSTVFNNGPFDLGGYSLEVTIENAQTLYVGPNSNNEFKNGTLIVKGSGTIDVQASFDMPTLSLDLGARVALNDHTFGVSNLVTRFTGTQSPDGSIHVYERFKPVSDRFAPVTIHAGAMLDLSERVDVLNVTTDYGNKLAYADDVTRVVIDLGARTPQVSDQLVLWTSEPDGITFALKSEQGLLEDALTVTPTGIFYGDLEDSNTVVSATWTGAAGDGDIANPENWTDCANAHGNEVNDGVPGDKAMVTLKGSVGFDFKDGNPIPWKSIVIGSCTLTRNCDWTGLGPYVGVVAEGSTIDLNGHKLFVVAPSGASSKALTVADSTNDASVPGEFHFVVADGAPFENEGTRFSGNLRLVKEGPGQFVSKIFNQSYSGGTTVAAGALKMFNDTAADSATYAITKDNPNPLGVHKSLIRVEMGATFDINGVYDLSEYRFELAGGTLINSKKQGQPTWGGLGNVALTTNSFQEVGKDTVCHGLFELGGYVLDTEIESGDTLSFGESTLSNGTFRAHSQGTLQVVGAVDARTADFDIACALNLAASLDVRNYTARCSSDTNAGSAALNVWGAFRPVTDYFYGCTLQDGATLDLRERTGVWSTKSAFVDGANVVTFAPNATITVDMTGRETVLGDGRLMKVVAWNEAPAKTKFRPDEATRAQGLRFVKHADGLYLTGPGLTVIVR